jgi:hypothetical protein
MSARHRHREPTAELCKIPDAVLRAGELREWGLVATACDLHLQDLIREHGRRWIAAGRNVLAASPVIGKDLNDEFRGVAS